MRIFAIVIDKLYGLSEGENNSKKEEKGIEQKKGSISHLIKYFLLRKNSEKNFLEQNAGISTMKKFHF